MKDIVNKCEEEIVKCNAVILPLLKKYGCKSTLGLLHNKTLTQEDLLSSLKFVHRRNAFSEIVNLLHYDLAPEFTEEDEDEDKKKKAFFNVFNEVLQKPSPAWDKLDAITTDRVRDNLTACIMTKDLEFAVLGIVYLLYQDYFGKTNKGDDIVKQVFGEKQDE